MDEDADVTGAGGGDEDDDESDDDYGDENEFVDTFSTFLLSGESFCWLTLNFSPGQQKTFVFQIER